MAAGKSSEPGLSDRALSDFEWVTSFLCTSALSSLNGGDNSSSTLYYTVQLLEGP